MILRLQRGDRRGTAEGEQEADKMNVLHPVLISVAAGLVDCVNVLYTVSISIVLFINSPSMQFFLSVPSLFQFVISYCLICKVIKYMPLWGVSSVNFRIATDGHGCVNTSFKGESR